MTQAFLMTVGHTVQFTDLIPNSIVIGASVLYVVDRAYDLCIRWAKGLPSQPTQVLTTQP